MKQAIRALTIATLILWILVIVFSVTAVYSVMNLGIGFGETQFFPSSKGVVLSLPFFINNSGYYDISELNVTTRVTDYNGTLLSLSETFVPLVASGSNVETAHNISIDLSDIMAMDYAELLFNDSSFELDAFIALNFAYAIPVQMSLNMTIPWGAPLSNLSIGEIFVLPYNSTHGNVVIPVSFENHSYFDIAGTIQLEVYNDVDELVTSGQTSLDVPSSYGYVGQVEMYLSVGDLLKLTGSGNLRLVFESPMFTVEQWIPYG
jgi:hypothetical protein